MRRNGFTMVELIFVIIIIGILSVAAIPKFGDIKDRAKAAAEYSALSSIDGAIEGAMEFAREDFNSVSSIDWHNATWNASGLTDTYKDVNGAKTVLSKILKKNENYKIVAYADTGVFGADGKYDDVFFIKGPASDATLGVAEADKTGLLNGKPDKTDVWVFNASPNDVTIKYDNSATNKIVHSGEIMVLDMTSNAADMFVDTLAGGIAGVIGMQATFINFNDNGTAGDTTDDTYTETTGDVAIVDSGL